MPKELPQTVTAAIETGEVVPREWSTTRKQIDRGGAMNIFDGFGTASIVINGHRVAAFMLRENEEGHAALHIIGIDAKNRQTTLGILDLEKQGIVPKREGPKR